MGNKTPLTPEQHREIGMKLALMQRDLQRLYIEICQHQAIRSKFPLAVNWTLKALSAARDAGDDRMVLDYPDTGDVGLSYYYPGLD